MVDLQEGIKRRYTQSRSQISKKHGIRIWIIFWASVTIAAGGILPLVMFGVSYFWGGLFTLVILAVLAMGLIFTGLEYGEESTNRLPIDVTSERVRFRRFIKGSDFFSHHWITISMHEITSTEVEIVREWTNGSIIQTSLGSKAWVLALHLKSGEIVEIIRDPYFVIEAANSIMQKMELPYFGNG